MESQQTPNEEKLEFLKREEVRTMKKDLFRLREEEARKESERIVKLEMEKKEKTEEEKKKIDLIPKKKSFSIKFWLKSQPLSVSQKIIVRVFIVILLSLIFAFIFTFWYWYLRTPSPITPEKTIPPAVKEKPAGKEIIPPKEKIVIPSALIPVDINLTSAVSEIKQIPSSLSQLIKKEEKEGEIHRIIIQDIKENKIIGLREFFEAFEVKSPENFLNNLENDFTLFSYSQKQGNKLGFVAKIKIKEGLPNLLNFWEPTMEDDYEKLFEILGKKEEPALVPYFQKAKYKEIDFRYQTFSQNDLGICYLVLDDYFVFTSSGESMIKIISQL